MSNQKDGVYRNREREFARYDALPAAIRQVFAAAPFKYAMLDEKQRKQRAVSRMSVALWRQDVIDFMCADLQGEARRTYGAEHPNAERSRLRRRA